ncbi:AIPR family protein [bacterium 210917-DFI.7.65]|nr:AIPR family protein [bacterium 210917-DFI.7.65]
MYVKILHDIQQAYYQDNYPNDGQRFVAWYLRNIHGLNTVEAKDCITDGVNDKQIDAVYINNQDSTIYIIQGKFMSGEYIDAEPVREVLSSWVLVQDLNQLQDAANAKLKVKINEISAALDDDYEICFELITTAKLTNQAQSDADTFSKKLADNEEMNANFIVVDSEMLKFKYDEALNKTNNYINFTFQLEEGKYLELELNGIRAVLAAVPLKDCISIPGIKDGRLFRKNVRQSLGNSNKVNKGIAKTIKKEPGDFFFYHNGITAICSNFDIQNGQLTVKDLNIVNGCQSLSTIFNCGEAAKKSYGYILFKFYEMANSEKADKITNSTNSQSAVKARDLRSNDKIVLNIKKNYEQTYPNGYMVTKRGENVDTTKYDAGHIIQLTDLGKELIAWHSQRPTLSYSETKIFDIYFTQLFKKDYPAEDVQALHELHSTVTNKWNPDNPMGLNESLLAMKSYAPFHHLYAISVIFAEISNMSEMVPRPSKVLAQLKKYDMMDTVVNIAGKTLNRAFKNANSKAIAENRVFSPQNWIKSKTSLVTLTEALRVRLDAMEDDETNLGAKIQNCCKLEKQDFESRWTAD